MADSIWTAMGTGLQAFAVNGVLLLGSLDRPVWAVAAAWAGRRSGHRRVFWTGCTLGLEKALGALGAISIGPMLAWGAMFLGVGGIVRWLEPRLIEAHRTRDRLSPFLGRSGRSGGRALGSSSCSSCTRCSSR